MARRGLPFGIAFMLVAGLGMTGETPGGPSSVLVWFDFDGDEVETGPYTLIAYEHARGSVSLTSLYRHSGSRSVEIRDVAGDGAFTELQGFFREMPAGKVYVHFAFLMAEPAESMNIALAGAGHFAMVEHGFGLWLKAKGGTLYHVTAGRERPLFPIRAFTWYVSDLAYDVDRGRYDLTITPERSRQPIVALRGVANPTGRAGSRIHKFSFIGDPPGVDRSNARFYVDDIIVRADHPVPDEGPLVAPGRRMLFVDIHRYYRSLLYDKPGCLPALGPEDFALSSLDLQTLAAAGQLKLYDDLADRRSPALPKDLAELLAPKLKAMAEWGQGCAAGCGGECALRFFEGAQAAVPEAKLFAMSRVLALAGQKRWKQADELFISIYPDWRSDPRFPAVCAILGMARGNLEEAERSLSASPESQAMPRDHPAIRRLWAGELDQSLARELQASFPVEWGDYVASVLSADHRYYLLLWQDRLDEATAYAERMVVWMREVGVAPGVWLERRGDALLWLGDVRGAQQSYEDSLKSLPDPDPVYAKLSDVHFALGDLEGERSYREKVYGSLRR